jgi:hypothetical protein
MASIQSCIFCRTLHSTSLFLIILGAVAGLYNAWNKRRRKQNGGRKWDSPVDCVLHLYSSQIFFRARERERELKSPVQPHCIVWNFGGRSFSQHFGFSLATFYEAFISICHVALVQQAHLRPLYQRCLAPSPKEVYYLIFLMARQP